MSTTRASGARHSIAAGEVVLASLPPWDAQPWLCTGVVYLAGLLRSVGVSARVVRPQAKLEDVPPAVLEASYATYLRDPPMDERLDAMARCYDLHPDFFEGLVDALLVGAERIIALSVFRNNVDVTLHVARLLKRRRPDAVLVLGGPESTEEPEALRLPWIDVVVGRGAERVWIPLVSALLEGRPERAPRRPEVWYGPALAGAAGAEDTAPLPPPPPPLIDYPSLLPLLVGDESPTVPVWLNLGCPYACAFCSNQNIYGRFTRGEAGRVLAQLEEIVPAWHRLDPVTNLNVQFSDATTNVLPEQFDALLEGVVEAQGRWPQQPALRGQVLLDRRVTEERVRLWERANFRSVFFGLDAADDGQRRTLGKPGTRAEVEAAVLAYARGGGRSLFYGVPVGMPGETREMFEANAAFVEWTLGLPGVVAGISVLPYMFFLSAQDPQWAARNKGERRGLLWRMDAPGGDPAERARRCIELFDRVDGRVEVASPFPPRLAWPLMLPEQEHHRLGAWFARHGRGQSQILGSPAGRNRDEPCLLDEGEAASLTTALSEATHPGPWRVVHVERSAQIAGVPAAVALLSDGERRVALMLKAGSQDRQAFARTSRFLVGYLSRWQDMDCDFDADLLRRGVDAIAAWELATGAPHPPSASAAAAKPESAAPSTRPSPAAKASAAMTNAPPWLATGPSSDTAGRA